MPDVKFGDVVAYNGGEGKSHRVAIVTDAKDGNLINLSHMDDDGNWSPVQKDVPRRSPEDYEAGGGGGHTWYYE